MRQRRERSQTYKKGFKSEGGHRGGRGGGVRAGAGGRGFGGVETRVENVPGTAVIGGSPIQSSSTVFRSNALCTIIITPHPAVRPAHNIHTLTDYPYPQSAFESVKMTSTATQLLSH